MSFKENANGSLGSELNYTLFVFVGIGLSAFLLVRSVGGNAAVVEKVNYTVWDFYVNPLDWYRSCPRFKTNVDSHILVYCQQLSWFLSDMLWRRYDSQLLVPEDLQFLYLSWNFKLTCWFLFQCPIECQCNLTTTIINITCPYGVSIVEVEYPSGDWSTSSPDWISQEGEDKESIAYNKLITIYFWYNTGLDIITQGAFKHLRYISECYLILSRNNITDLKERQFEELSKLRGLLLDNNRIASLHQNAFIGLNSLVYLCLQQNEIVNLFLICFKN